LNAKIKFSLNDEPKEFINSMVFVPENFNEYIDKIEEGYGTINFDFEKKSISVINKEKRKISDYPITPEDVFKNNKQFFGVDQFFVHHDESKNITGFDAYIRISGFSRESEINNLLWLYKTFCEDPEKITENLRVKNNLLELKEDAKIELPDFKNILDFIEKKNNEIEINKLIDFNCDPTVNLGLNTFENESNTLKIDYTSRKSPIYQEIEIIEIEIKNEGQKYKVNEIIFYNKKVNVEARRNIDDVNFKIDEKSVLFYNKKLSKLLGRQGFIADELIDVRVTYKNNQWPLEVEKVSLFGKLGFLKLKYDPELKETSDMVEKATNRYKNLSLENSLFLSYLFKNNKQELLTAFAEVFNKPHKEITNISEDEFIILEMNCPWMPNIKTAFEELFLLYNEIKKSFENDEVEIGSRKYIKKIRKSIEGKGFTIQVQS
jgi:hypothetical protein